MAGERPEISVIVVNWNGREYLPTCLEALRQQRFRGFETLLVDNGSQDGSCAYVRAQYPEVRLLELGRNLGFVGANQAGYDVARTELIALLNNDTEAHPRWLEALWEASIVHPEAGSFASKMLFFDQRERIENCGHALCPGGYTMLWGRGEPDGPAWNRPRAVFGACGGAVLYRRSMLRKIGFYSPDFFMTYEDFDLAFRAQLRGYTCQFVPDAIVYHRYRATMRNHADRQVFYSQRNIEYAYWRNMPLALVVRHLPQRLLYEAGAAVHALAQGSAGAFMRAKLAALAGSGRIWRQRRAIQKSRTVNARELRALMTPGGAGIKWRKLLRGLRLIRRGEAIGE